jgi:hypothetical protein
METKHRIALQRRLAALPDLAGVIVGWQPVSPDAPAPLAILRAISDQRGASHAGDDGIREARVQIDAYAADDYTAQGIRDAITDSLHGIAEPLTPDGPAVLSCLDDGSFEDFDEVARLTRASRYFVFQYASFSGQYPT